MVVSKRITVAVILLLASSLCWAQPVSTTATYFQSNFANYSQASRLVPSDMLAQLWNPPASGHNIFVDQVIVSAVAPGPLEIGISFDPIFNPSCTAAETSARIGGSKAAPVGVFTSFPCATHPANITDASYERFYLHPATMAVRDETGHPLLLEPGRGLSLWDDYEFYATWNGALTLTIKWHQCPLLDRCQ